MIVSCVHSSVVGESTSQVSGTKLRRRVWARESSGTVCVYAGVVNGPEQRRRGRGNPVVECVPVQVWSTDQDGEDVGASQSSGAVCVCAGVVNRPCDTGRRNVRTRELNCTVCGRVDEKNSKVLCVCAGVVPEPTSQVAQDGEDLGTKQHYGGVRAVRRNGTTLSPVARNHR